MPRSLVNRREGGERSDQPGGVFRLAVQRRESMIENMVTVLGDNGVRFHAKKTGSN